MKEHNDTENTQKRKGDCKEALVGGKSEGERWKRKPTVQIEHTLADFFLFVSQKISVGYL